MKEIQKQARNVRHTMAKSKKYLLTLFIFISVLMNSAVFAQGIPAILDRGALYSDKIIYLDQNWTDEDREYFYFTDQGSRLLPYDFYLNLEHPDRKQRLSNPKKYVALWVSTHTTKQK